MISEWTVILYLNVSVLLFDFLKVVEGFLNTMKTDVKSR